MNLYKERWEHPRYKEFLDDCFPHHSLLIDLYSTPAIAVETCDIAMDIWIHTFYPAMPFK